MVWAKVAKQAGWCVMFQYYKNWMEFWFLVLVVVGILIALSAPSAVISYVIIFLSGILAGRVVYKRKNKMKFPYFMIVVGLVIGYLIGAYYGSRWVVIALFIIGAISGYRLYEKRIIKDTAF